VRLPLISSNNLFPFLSILTLLAAFPSSRFLSLRACQIKAEGAKCFVRCLQLSLYKLDIRDNEIGCEVRDLTRATSSLFICVLPTGDRDVQFCRSGQGHAAGRQREPLSQVCRPSSQESHCLSRSEANMSRFLRRFIPLLFYLFKKNGLSKAPFFSFIKVALSHFLIFLLSLPLPFFPGENATISEARSPRSSRFKRLSNISDRLFGPRAAAASQEAEEEKTDAPLASLEQKAASLILRFDSKFAPHFSLSIRGLTGSVTPEYLEVQTVKLVIHFSMKGSGWVGGSIFANCKIKN
jgi:hypothetical protein